MYFLTVSLFLLEFFAESHNKNLHAKWYFSSWFFVDIIWYIYESIMHKSLDISVVHIFNYLVFRNKCYLIWKLQINKIQRIYKRYALFSLHKMKIMFWFNDIAKTTVQTFEERLSCSWNSETVRGKVKLFQEQLKINIAVVI